LVHFKQIMPTRQLSVSGRLDKIEVVGSIVDECAQSAGFDERTNYACQLAVGEACENIILHGYGEEGAGTIEVIVHAKPGELTIELWDSAPPFNVAKEPQPVPCTPEDPPIGGLGLKIIHKVMDKVEYKRRGNRNCLRLCKSSPTVT
jgi:anti-sigma regulatory factor (Ser/Thr protein kinase)